MMRGFIKRDFYLMRPTLKIYAGALLVLLAVGFFAKMESLLGFISMYVCIFTISACIGLFNYDEADHWQAYAAAMPNGRKAQVDGRYAVAALLLAAVAVLELAVCLAARMSAANASVFLGIALFVESVAMPLSYRFGINKSRVFIMAIAAVSAILVSVGTIGMLSSGSLTGRAPAHWWTGVSLAVVAAGAAAFLISHRVSVAIMARKEL